MSVLIKNMEMPNKKNGAVLIIYPDGKCAFEDGKTYQAVHVPPHGDLIDRSVLYKKTAEWEEQARDRANTAPDARTFDKWATILTERSSFKFDVADAPTIIPATEEGENAD